jgi:hypothetical protein
LVEKKSNARWAIAVFSVCAFLCIYAFYLLGSKNGIADSIIIFLVFSLLFLYKIFSGKIKLNLKIITFIAASLLILLTILSSHLQKYRSWEMLVHDAKIGLQIDRYDHWKYSGKKGYPENDLYTPVTNTNYERMAWAVVGINLIGKNPLGYGLVERSFADLTKIKWPESELDQSHSAWIDLTLGIGVVGIIAVLLAVLGTVINLHKLQGQLRGNLRAAGNDFRLIVARGIISGLLATCLGWVTAEICQKNQLIMLVFWVLIGSGFTLGEKQRKPMENVKSKI